MERDGSQRSVRLFSFSFCSKRLSTLHTLNSRRAESTSRLLHNSLPGPFLAT